MVCVDVNKVQLCMQFMSICIIHNMLYNITLYIRTCTVVVHKIYTVLGCRHLHSVTYWADCGYLHK